VFLNEKRRTYVGGFVSKVWGKKREVRGMFLDVPVCRERQVEHERCHTGLFTFVGLYLFSTEFCNNKHREYPFGMAYLDRTNPLETV